VVREREIFVFRSRNARKSTASDGRGNRCLVSLTLVLLTLAACGGGGDGGTDEDALIRTLAYVVTACREDARETVASQKLLIRQSDGTVVTVLEFSRLGPFPPLGLCRL
jgi:hypothetical protein